MNKTQSALLTMIVALALTACGRSNSPDAPATATVASRQSLTQIQKQAHSAAQDVMAAAGDPKPADLDGLVDQIFGDLIDQLKDMKLPDVDADTKAQLEKQRDELVQELEDLQKKLKDQVAQIKAPAPGAGSPPDFASIFKF